MKATMYGVRGNHLSAKTFVLPGRSGSCSTASFDAPPPSPTADMASYVCRSSSAAVGVLSTALESCARVEGRPTEGEVTIYHLSLFPIFITSMGLN